MNNNLQPARLGELLTSLKTGLNPRKNFKLNTKDANNWYVTVRELNGLGIDFLPQTDKVNDSGLKLINNRSNLEIGDVLFSGTGTIGKTAIVDKIPSNWNIKEGVYSLKPNKDRLDSYYLMYLLKYLATLNIFNKISAGSTVFSVPMNILEDLKIKIHDLNGQINVSKVLKTIDFKIELNKRINAELESVAKNLYDYWFVQFDFPDENGKPYKSSGGKMVRNEDVKREIPEGWTVGGFDDIGEVVGGSTPSKANKQYFTRTGIPWITPKDLSINTGKKFISRGETDITLLGLKDASLKTLPKGSVLLSSRAPIGYLAISRGEVTTNQGFKSIVPNNSYTTEYVYYTVQTYINAMIQYSSGSTFSEISASTLKLIKIPLPNPEIVMKYTQKVKDIFSQQDILENENDQLTALRDWILPMLMSGQVTVTDD